MTRTLLSMVGIAILSLGIYATRHLHAQNTQPAVEPVPTVDQCRKDGPAWYSKDAQLEYDKARFNSFSTGKLAETEFSKLSAHDLYVRMKDMGNCITVDPQNSERYDSSSYHYYGFIADRFMDYMERHKLLEDFMKEDAQGKR